MTRHTLGAVSAKFSLKEWRGHLRGRLQGRLRGLLLAACATAALTACQTPGLQGHEVEQEVDEATLTAFLADKPAELAPYYEILLRQGDRNKVLNNMRIGLAAMDLGETAMAEAALDDALNQIEVVYADNEAAEEARSLWTKENRKDFKGEPYERAMAYFYRGLLYMDAGDYQNASAVFRAAQLMDAYAEEDQNRADFALMYFMEGWASRCAGFEQTAQTAFDAAAEFNSSLQAPPLDHTLLVLRETGTAPRKVATGEYNELLAYEQGQMEGFSSMTVSVDTGAEALGQQAEDIFFQASTRGGRIVDTVLAGKASFKENADVAGDALQTAGMTTAMIGAGAGNNDAAVVGLALMFAGLVAEGVAAAARTEADIRQWDNLPNRISLATLPNSATSGTATTTLNGVSSSTREFEFRSAGACSLGWSRSSSALDIPLRAPGSGGEES